MRKRTFGSVVVLMFLLISGCGGGGGGGGSTSGGTSGGSTGAPVITGVSVSKPVVLSNGQTSTITVNANDPGGNSLSYAFTSSGGTLTRLSGNQYTFSTSTPGEYTVSIKVTDSAARFTTASTQIVSFGADTTMGGMKGTLTTPVSAQSAASAQPADSGNTLASPLSVDAAPARDLSREVVYAAKGAPASCEGENFDSGEYVVKLRNPDNLAAFAQRNGLTVIKNSPNGFALVEKDGLMTKTDVISRTLSRQTCRDIGADPDISFADMNHKMRALSTVPNDPHYADQWQYPLLNLPQAWDITTGSSSVVVAVLDTGIVSGHADLSSRISGGYDFVRNTTSACDGNGIDSNPEDVSDSRCAGGAISYQSQEHSHYHGSHVAGTIGAATNNSAGVAGVNWNVRIMPVRVLGKDGGTDYDIIQGLYYAAGLPNDSGTTPPVKAKVVNMSLGGDPGNACPSSYNAAFNDLFAAGVTVLVAAGNESKTSAINPLALCNHAVAVTAVDRYSKKAWYANEGGGITVAAPGGDTSSSESDGILSTVRNDNTGNNTAYAYMQGTSMATPHVAGVAALMIAADPAITPTQIVSILASTATDLGPAGTDTTFGAGLVNAYKAVLEAKKLVANPIEPAVPVMTLSTNSLYFSQDVTSNNIVITNSGTGSLSLTSVSDSENSGGNWLATSTSNGANSVTLTASVNRGGLAAGTYTGAIVIHSNGGNATVNVTMQVTAPTPQPPAGCTDSILHVIAVNSSTNVSTSAAEVSLAATSFKMFEVPAGAYYVVAGTDCNSDGYICDQDTDYCGYYAFTDQLKTVDVASMQYSANIDIPLTKTTANSTGSPAAATLPKGAYKIPR